MARLFVRGERKCPLWKAGEVADVAREMIGEDKPHSRLMGKKIIYAFQKRLLKVGGRDVVAKCEVIGGKAAALHRALPDWETTAEGEERFFLVTVAQGAWSNLSPSQKRAVVDAALCRAGFSEKGTPTLWAPDVVEFRAVIIRHGLYTQDLAKFGAICAEKASQTTLDLDTPEPVEALSERLGTEAAADGAPVSADAVMDALAADNATLTVVNGGGSLRAAGTRRPASEARQAISAA